MPKVQVQRDSYRRSLHHEIEELKSYSLQEYDRAISTTWDPRAIAREVKESMPDSPLWESILREDVEGIGDHRSDLTYRALDLLKTDFSGYKHLRELQQRVDSYYQFLDSLESPRDIEEEYKGSELSAIQLEEQTTKGVVSAIESAVGRSIGFSSPVAVEPMWSKGAWDKAPSTYYVSLGSEQNAPSFTLFLKADGSIESVEDILEGGDDDFFKDSKQQYDYFNLVNELRKPGSTSKGKLLWLYTARPIRDRSRYESAKTVPVNIFLASTFDHALGLATDLGGSEQRDVWKVQIDSRYLVQTLDGTIKHYQTVGAGREVPVRYMELVVEGKRLSSRARNVLGRSNAFGWSGDSVTMDVWQDPVGVVRLSIETPRGMPFPPRLDLLDGIVGLNRMRKWDIVKSQSRPGFIQWTFSDVSLEGVRRYADTLFGRIDPYMGSILREREAVASAVVRRYLQS